MLIFSLAQHRFESRHKRIVQRLYRIYPSSFWTLRFERSQIRCLRRHRSSSRTHRRTCVGGVVLLSPRSQRLLLGGLFRYYPQKRTRSCWSRLLWFLPCLFVFLQFRSTLFHRTFQSRPVYIFRYLWRWSLWIFFKKLWRCWNWFWGIFYTKTHCENNG